MSSLGTIFEERVAEMVVGFFVSFLPKLFWVLVIFLVGWVVAEVLKKILVKILKGLGLDNFFEKKGWQAILQKAELEFSISEFLGAILKWVVVIFVLMIIGDYLGWQSFSQFLQRVLLWVPNLIVAVLIFVVMVIIADILGKIFRAWAEGIKLQYSGILEGMIKAAIYLFGTFIILEQLGVGEFVVNSLAAAILATISLSLGLAFGLGGKEVAREILEGLKNKFFKK